MPAVQADLEHLDAIKKGSTYEGARQALLKERGINPNLNEYIGPKLVKNYPTKEEIRKKQEDFKKKLGNYGTDDDKWQLF